MCTPAASTAVTGVFACWGIAAIGAGGETDTAVKVSSCTPATVVPRMCLISARASGVILKLRGTLCRDLDGMPRWCEGCRYQRRRRWQCIIGARQLQAPRRRASSARINCSPVKDSCARMGLRLSTEYAVMCTLVVN